MFRDRSTAGYMQSGQGPAWGRRARGQALGVGREFRGLMWLTLVPSRGGHRLSPAACVVQVAFLLALLVHSSHTVSFTAKELHPGLPGG